MKVAFFVSANAGYLPYLNAFLNSLAKRGVHRAFEALDVCLIHDDLPKDYLKAASSAFPFTVRPIRINVAETSLDESWQSSWICKAARYHYLRQHGADYDVACLMDADLFLVSSCFANLFGLVAGTQSLIGCNERIKWSISDIYRLNGKPMLEEKTRLYKFHCNVPLLLDVRQWREVLDEYLRIVFRGREHRNGDVKVIGDLYSWNLALYRLERQDDVVLFPMETMTQVHKTGYREWTKLEVSKEGYWMTRAGDEVFAIHARPDKPGFRKVNLAKERIDSAVFEKYARLVEREWYDLNFNQTLVLSDFCPMKPQWEALA